jgi:hypothetical protein
MRSLSEYEEELSREEVLKAIDGVARSRLGISGEQLLKLYRSGRLDDPDEVADALVLADLLTDEHAIA